MCEKCLCYVIIKISRIRILLSKLHTINIYSFPRKEIHHKRTTRKDSFFHFFLCWYQHAAADIDQVNDRKTDWSHSTTGNYNILFWIKAGIPYYSGNSAPPSFSVQGILPQCLFFIELLVVYLKKPIKQIEIPCCIWILQYNYLISFGSLCRFYFLDFLRCFLCSCYFLWFTGIKNQIMSSGPRSPSRNQLSKKRREREREREGSTYIIILNTMSISNEYITFTGETTQRRRETEPHRTTTNHFFQFS